MFSAKGISELVGGREQAGAADTSPCRISDVRAPCSCTPLAAVQTWRVRCHGPSEPKRQAWSEPGSGDTLTSESSSVKLDKDHSLL